jgi:hypothetical protein
MRDLNDRTVVVFFLEARLGFDVCRSNAWMPGPLPIGGYEGTDQLCLAVRRSVVGLPHERRRNHLDLDGEPRPLGEGWLLGVDTLALAGLSDGSCVLLLHVVLEADSAPFRLGRPLDLSSLNLPSLLGGPVALSDQWRGSPVQRPLTNPTAVAELVCAPDRPDMLPEPAIRFEPASWSDYEYRMYELIRDEPEPTPPDDIVRGLERIFPIGGGTMLIGAFRSVAEGDFGNEVRLRTFVVNGLLAGVVQRVMLDRLARMAAELADPTSNPRGALALSRAVTGYRAVHGPSTLARTDLDSEIAARYRDRTALEALEQQASSFETAAQAAMSADTNLLLAVVAIGGFALAIAAGVETTASWKGWSTLWSLLVAVVVAIAIGLLPPGRSLRAALAAQLTAFGRRKGRA